MERTASRKDEKLTKKILLEKYQFSEPSCSKIMALLVNETLNVDLLYIKNTAIIYQKKKKKKKKKKKRGAFALLLTIFQQKY